MPQELIPVAWLFVVVIAITLFLVFRGRHRAKKEKVRLDAAFSARANQAIIVFATRLKCEGIEPASLNLLAQRGLDGQIDLTATNGEKKIVANGEYNHGDGLLSFSLA